MSSVPHFRWVLERSSNHLLSTKKSSARTVKVSFLPCFVTLWGCLFSTFWNWKNRMQQLMPVIPVLPRYFDCPSRVDSFAFANHATQGWAAQVQAQAHNNRRHTPPAVSLYRRIRTLRCSARVSTFYLSFFSLVSVTDTNVSSIRERWSAKWGADWIANNANCREHFYSSLSFSVFGDKQPLIDSHSYS